MGITGKDIPKGQWAEIDLPESKSKVEYCACDNSGSFCLLVTDKGTVYFGGVNKKGEAGENRKYNMLICTCYLLKCTCLHVIVNKGIL